MPETRAALIIAASNYDDPKFQQLRAPARDATELVRVLGEPTIGGFSIRTLFNEPSHVLTEQLEGFFDGRSPNDLLLLYFSCHGMKDKNGRLYFVTTNTKFDRLLSTGISSVLVNEVLERSRSRRIVLLLDCCYSGAFARGFAPKSTAADVNLTEEFQGQGVAIIAASSSMEYAFEGHELSADSARPSFFTQAVVQGLETGEADQDGDGKTSVKELYEYVYKEVRKRTPGQTPTLAVHDVQGEIHLARNPLWTPERHALRQVAQQRLSPTAAVSVGALLANQGDLEGAMALYQQAADSGDILWAPRAASRLGALLEQLNNLEGARTAYDKAMKSSDTGEASKAAFSLGRVLEQLDDLAGARTAYGKAVTSADPEEAAQAAFSLGRILEQLNDLKGAKAAYQRAAESGHPDNAPRALNDLARVLEQLNDLKGAKAAYQRAARSRHHSEAAKAAFSLGRILEQQNDLDGARAAYDKAVTSADPEEAAQAAFSLGRILEQLNDLDGARTAYQRASQSKNRLDAGEVAFRLGRILEQLNDPADARMAYQRALDLGYRETPAVLNRLGFVLDQLFNRVEARSAYSQAMESGDAHWAPVAANNLGLLLQQQTDFPAAQAAYQRAIDSGHTDEAPKAAFSLGCVREQVGDPAGARAAYQLAIDSGHPKWASRAKLNLALMGQGRPSVPDRASSVPAATFERAMLFERDGNFRRAQTLYREVIKMGNSTWTTKAQRNLTLLLERAGQLGATSQP